MTGILSMIGILPKNIYMSPRRTDYVKRLLHSQTADSINNEIFKEKDGYFVSSKNLQQNEFPQILDKKNLRAAVKFLKAQDGGLLYSTGSYGAYNPDLSFEYIGNLLDELEYGSNGYLWGWLNMQLAFVHGKQAVKSGFLYHPQTFGAGGQTVGGLLNNIQWDRSKGKFTILNRKLYSAIKYIIDQQEGITLDAFVEGLMESSGGNMDSSDVMSGVSDAVLGFISRKGVIQTLEDYARSLFYTEDTADMQPVPEDSDNENYYENQIEYAPPRDNWTPF